MLGVTGSSVVVVAAAFLFYAVLSRRLDGTPVTAAMIFVAVGLVFSNRGLDWLHLNVDQEGVQLLAEATLAVVLFTDASRIDLHTLRREYGVPTRLLAVGLPLTIVAGSLMGAVLLHAITWTEALVVAIVLAPTDAALGQAVVTDPGLPSPIRQGLNVESGLNDGLCVPLLAIALALAQANAGQFSDAHAATVVAEAIGWGLAGGIVAGLVAAQAVRISSTRGWIEEHWLEVVPVIAAAGAYGIADSLGGSGFIAAFIGGVVYGRLVGRQEAPAAFSEELGGLLSGITFIVFGAAVLSTVWSRIGIREVVYAVLEPHRDPDGSRRHRDAGLTGANADCPVPRLVRPTGAGVDRVRGGDRRRRQGCHTLRPWSPPSRPPLRSACSRMASVPRHSLAVTQRGTQPPPPRWRAHRHMINAGVIPSSAMLADASAPSAQPPAVTPRDGWP